MLKLVATVIVAVAALWFAAPTAAATDPSYAIVVSQSGPIHVGDTVTLTPVVSNVAPDTQVRCFMTIERWEGGDAVRMHVASDGCQPWTFTVPPAPFGTYQIDGLVAIGLSYGYPQSYEAATDSFIDLVDGGTPVPFVTNYPVQSWDLADMISTSTPQYGEPITIKPPVATDLQGCELRILGGFEFTVTDQWTGCEPWTFSMPERVPQGPRSLFEETSDTRVMAWTGTSAYGDQRPEAAYIGAMYGETYNTYLGDFESGTDGTDYTSNLPAIFTGPDRAHSLLVGDPNPWSFAPVVAGTSSGMCHVSSGDNDEWVTTPVVPGGCRDAVIVPPWPFTIHGDREIHLELLDDQGRTISSSEAQVGYVLPMDDISLDTPTKVALGASADISASTDSGAPASYEITAEAEPSGNGSASTDQSSSTTIASGYFDPTPDSAGDAIDVAHAFQAPGRYTITATFTDVLGTKTSGASIIDVRGSDTTPPTVSLPSVSVLGSRTLSSTAKVHVSWPSATDVSRIVSYQLQKRKGSGSWTTVSLSSPTARSADVSVVPGTNYAFRLRATDKAHNTSAWVTTATAKLALVQENSSAIHYSGTWKRASLSGTSGGYVEWAQAANAKADYTFAGTAIAFVADSGPARGKFEIWLDGSKVSTLDLYSATGTKKRIFWSSPSLTAGNHTFELRTLGTGNAKSTNTRVDLDALLLWA